MRIIPDLNSNDLPIGGSGYVGVEPSCSNDFLNEIKKYGWTGHRPVAMVNDNPNRKEHIIPAEELNKISPIFGHQPLSVSFDHSSFDRIKDTIAQLETTTRQINLSDKLYPGLLELNFRRSDELHRQFINEAFSLLWSSFNNNKPKNVNTFNKDKQVKVICKSLPLKNALMEYAREAGVPTICADQQSRPELPYIGWSGKMICGFDANSHASTISVDLFIHWCDNWKEAQKPVIRLNGEQTVKIDYDAKIVVAGCNHQYKLPFKLIDEIHAKMHEKDEKKELVKFKAHEWLPVFNKDLYYSAIEVAKQNGIPFHGTGFEGSYFDNICIFFDLVGGVQWGNRKSEVFTSERELSQSDFLTRCLNHNK